jgi:hypothetical protein
VILIQVVAAVSDLREFLCESPMIFGTMHFDQKNRALNAEQLLSTLKNGDFRSLYVTFEEIGSWMRRDKLVEGDSFD